MNWQEVGQTIGKFAPLLGGVVGGPGGAAIGALVASTLGVENEPEAISLAIKNNPQAAVNLKELQLTHKERLEELALHKLTVELGDKANARESHKHSVVPALIVGALTLMVAAGAYLLFVVDIPDSNKEICYLLFGTALAKWGDSIAYWVGTTRSSANKDQIRIGR